MEDEAKAAEVEVGGISEWGVGVKSDSWKEVEGHVEAVLSAVFVCFCASAKCMAQLWQVWSEKEEFATRILSPAKNRGEDWKDCEDGEEKGELVESGGGGLMAVVGLVSWEFLCE